MWEKSLLIIFLVTSNIALALERETDLTSGNSESEYTFFKGEKTSVKNPFELRDPFKEESFKRSSGGKKKSLGVDSVGENGNFSNLPTIDSISSLDKIRVIGVLLGKERRALAKIGTSKDIIILKEGMKIGADAIELKAILPGGIVFVEKIRNVYDQDEYLETVIPVSTE